MNNVPNLRFKEFSGDWEKKRFSKYIKLYRGSSPRPIQSYLTSGEGVNWIKIGDAKDVNNYILDKVSEKITFEGSLKSRKVDIGELILANSMSFGATYMLGIQGCIYDGWFVLREYEPYFNKLFLLQQLNSDFLQKQYKKLSTGGVVQNISSDIVYSTKLCCPSLQEQEKIASFFSLIDKKIELQTEKVEELKNYKKGIMQKIFSQELRFKDENGNDYPEWEEKKLGSLINEYEDKAESNNKYPILSSTLNGIVLQSDYFSKQTASVDTTGYKIVPRGYFTYRSMSDTGVFRFNIQEVVDFGIVSPAYPVFSCSDEIDSKFLEIVLNHSSGVKRQLLITKEGGTRYALGFTKLKQIQVMLPCKLEQEKIGCVLNKINEKIETEELKLVQLSEYKKGLLQQMFI